MLLWVVHAGGDSVECVEYEELDQTASLRGWTVGQRLYGYRSQGRAGGPVTVADDCAHDECVRSPS